MAGQALQLQGSRTQFRPPTGGSHLDGDARSGRNLTLPGKSRISDVAGHGPKATVNGRDVLVGNAVFFP